MKITNKNLKMPLHIEVVQNSYSDMSKELIKQLTNSYVQCLVSVTPGDTINNSDFEEHFQLKEHVIAIHFCNIDQTSETLDLTTIEIKYDVYKLNKFGAEVDTIDGTDGQEDELPAANIWTLPCRDFHGLWDNLVFDSQVKEDTLHYVETTLLFSDQKVNPNIINWNRVVLLHGPPGTGKTSLCKALSQKLSIRLADRYRNGVLVEINSHSLFSKWFSESGKLVMKLFTKIKEIIEDPQMLVCVLIDEVESLTHARKAALSGCEPSDSIRVVNAILTQIDQIQRFPNVLILTTSNMTGAIDLAFVDRADIKQYVGLPSAIAIYQIYHTCLIELMRVGIIAPKEQLFTSRVLDMCQYSRNDTTAQSLDLWSVAKYSVGLSGRTLRKIPFLAHALFLSTCSVTLTDFLVAMQSAVKKNLTDCDVFTNDLSSNNSKDNNCKVTEEDNMQGDL